MPQALIFFEDFYAVEKKDNAFVRFFKCIGRGIKKFFFFLIYAIAYIFIYPFARSKTVGKENVKDDDEARIFIANHYELFSPVSMYMSFPYKFKPWIIDKMMEKDKVEDQMGLMVYNNFKFAPMFLKKFVVKTLGGLTVFAMNHAGGISVSREDIRANFKTFEISTNAMEKGFAVAIWPEKTYVGEGVGEFQNGFEHLAKYYYKKTGKKVSFYPVFVSKDLKTFFISERIVYNPNNESKTEKENLVIGIRDAMVKLYQEKELANEKLQKKRERRRIKQEKKDKKRALKKQKREQRQKRKPRKQKEI